MKTMKRMIIAIVVFATAMTHLAFADWVKENDRYRFLNAANGTYVVNNWLQTGNGYYFFDQAGYCVVGWYLIDGKYYYFDENGLMQTGFKNIGGKTYYFDTVAGHMVTGWVQTYRDGVVDYYYFDATGAMAQGWIKIDNKWYYFNEGKCIINTFAQVNNIWYHFNNTGAMDTGWISNNGKMYFFNLSDGSLVRGWIQDQNGNEYYLSDIDGSLVVNMTINVAGVACTFDDMGRCVAKNAEAIGTAAQVNSTLNGSQPVAYGINVGVSPAMNQIGGVVTSAQNQLITNQDLAAGSTNGPN